MSGDRVELQQSTEGAVLSNMANVAADNQRATLPKVFPNEAAANAIPDMELFDSVQEQIDGFNEGIRATVTPGTLDCRPNSGTAPDRPKDLEGAARDLGSLLKDGAKQRQVPPWIRYKHFNSQILKL